MSPISWVVKPRESPGGRAALKKSQCAFCVVLGIIPDSISSQMRKEGQLGCAVQCTNSTGTVGLGCRLLLRVFKKCSGLLPSQVD